MDASHFGGVETEEEIPVPVGSCSLVGSSLVMAMGLRCRNIGRTYFSPLACVMWFFAVKSASLLWYERHANFLTSLGTRCSHP
ncbi:hypothetical protein T440DRAFT_234969 [Plenodomus tracheiphilus IPT5]|uniref:Uncharacterized protein n=1 Tax=Plenodomus tracheiphilus IPT5 TaxID=1408161 RepID=A0A6A7BJ78_9PLEO|nr:hypothetical protein T440DRAFT_234969 [Plenodomus tracheiphilus IPT5]